MGKTKVRNMKKLITLIALAAIIASCKNGWNASDRNNFITGCEKKATITFGEEKGKAYCSCMQQKLEAKFHDPADVAKLTPEQMQAPGMDSLVQACLGNDNTNKNNNKDNPLGNGLGNQIGTNNNNNAGAGWTKEEEEKWMNACIKGGEDNQRNRAICSCVLQKAEKKYATYAEEERVGTNAEGRQWGQECANGIDGGNTPPLGNTNDNNNHGNWTDQQHQQYVQACVNTAMRNQGVTTQRANAYCECMTRKIEKKYGFAEASQLTTADFQTEEMQNAITDCRTSTQDQ
jgi:hypothetical protein